MHQPCAPMMHRQFKDRQDFRGGRKFDVKRCHRYGKDFRNRGFQRPEFKIEQPAQPVPPVQPEQSLPLQRPAKPVQPVIPQ